MSFHSAIVREGMALTRETPAIAGPRRVRSVALHTGVQLNEHLPGPSSLYSHRGT